ncbi:MAG: AsnC family transcriptional regulator [Deltaproteobacteria bacterium]|nr:AsnC family transcriptional regulator [Deltaproteobacteria bacterium]
MDSLDRQICTILQSDFPLDLQPFLRVAEKVGISEDEVLRRIGELRKTSVIREISAIFDTRNLGFISTLVAMQIPEENLSKAARAINEFPGVSHNYKREDHFNLWFTVAVPPGRDLNDTIQVMAYEAGALATLILPTLKLFKIGVRLDMTGKTDSLEREAPQQFKRVRRSLTEKEVELVRALQEDLEAVSHPFQRMATRIGVSELEVLGIIHSLMEEGIMRRFAAVLYHRKAGFAFNGMGVWRVPEEKIATLGPVMGSFRGVSHCYWRPTYQEWSYSLYTMVHGMNQNDCEKIIETVSKETGITDYKILYSTIEYKKERITYYSTAFDDWYKAHTIPQSYIPEKFRHLDSYASIY